MDGGEHVFVSRVEEAVRANEGPALVALLSERDSVYAGRGSSRVERMRAYALAAFARIDVPSGAIPFIREELATGANAYGVAASASVLASHPELARAFLAELSDARRRIAFSDEHVALREYGAAAGRHDRTAIEWLDLALNAGRTSGPCCAIDASWRRSFAAAARAPVPLDELVAESTHEETLLLADLVRGRPALLAFFYTRCENPTKCSLTMSQLGKVARHLTQKQSDAVVIAITYDPSFDTPIRLRAYSEARGFYSVAGHRVIRVVQGFERLSESLELGAGFVGSLPNRHRVEAYALDRNGRVAFTYSRAQLEPDVVVADLDGLSRSPLGTRWFGTVTIVFGTQLAVALIPRCPMCWVAYLSLFGLGDLGFGAYYGWIAPLAVGLSALHIWASFRRARVVADWLGFTLALLGALVTLVGALWLRERSVALAGVALGVMGTVWTSLVRQAWLPQAPGKRGPLRPFRYTLEQTSHDPPSQ